MWEWSHTQEAYENARQHVKNMSKKELLVILREWAYHDREKADKKPSFRLTFDGRKMPKDILAEKVWERAEGQRTCSNGGHDCYVCPDGCHTVPFDEPKDGIEVD